jgi:hypothetical protein
MAPQVQLLAIIQTFLPLIVNKQLLAKLEEIEALWSACLVELRTVFRFLTL